MVAYPELNCQQTLNAGCHRLSLGSFPTPLEEMPSSLGNGWIKRDDLTSDLYGGNKVRKLEFYLCDGLPGPVITFGGTGSHHVLATALFAHRMGRECTGVLVDQPNTDHTQQVYALLQRHCDRIIRLTPTAHLAGTLPGCLKTLIQSRYSTVIPPGATSRRGTLGYLLAALELKAQFRDLHLSNPDEVWVPLGTGGTAAGLALGFGLGKMNTRVVAVRVATAHTGNEGYIRFLSRMTFRYLRALGQRGPMPLLRVRVVNDFAGPGYGVETREGRAAVWAAKAVGLDLEGTYTGKCLAAMSKDMKEQGPNRSRVFINTYGPIQPLCDTVETTSGAL